MYKAIAVLGEGVWQIDVILGEYEDEKYAERIAKTDSSGFVFIMRGEMPAIMARVAGVVTFFDDKDVIINEISKEKQAVMGEPLDMSIEGNKEKALDALINKDPAYMITEKDMVPSEKTLLDLITEYGLGYKPDHLAYYVEKI
jgi:hypothetical protein